MEKLLKSSEVANLLHIHRNTLRRIPKTYLMYYTINPRGDRRYSFEDVIRYLNKDKKNENYG